MLDGLNWTLSWAREEVNALKEVLCSGGASDYPDYRYLVGRLYTLQILEGEILAKIKVIEGWENRDD